MGWFERQAAGRPPHEVSREHGRYLRAAGLDRALEELAGPFGLRRFIVFFEKRGQGVRVVGIDAVPLALGGGPPPAHPTGRGIEGVERALTALHRNMSLGPAWERGAVSFLRDASGRTTITSVFDEDADHADIDALPIPGPPGHPLEDPAWLSLRANWEGKVAAIQARTAAIAADWDAWEVRADTTLLLQYGVSDDGSAPPRREQRLRCLALATFEPARGAFRWQVDPPLFAEKAFAVKEFRADYEAATDLALLAAARIDARWLFTAPYDDEGSLLLAAVFE